MQLLCECYEDMSLVPLIRTHFFSFADLYMIGGQDSQRPRFLELMTNTFPVNRLSCLICGSQ